MGLNFVTGLVRKRLWRQSQLLEVTVQLRSGSWRRSIEVDVRISVTIEAKERNGIMAASSSATAARVAAALLVVCVIALFLGAAEVSAVTSAGDGELLGLLLFLLSRKPRRDIQSHAVICRTETIIDLVNGRTAFICRLVPSPLCKNVWVADS